MQHKQRYTNRLQRMETQAVQQRLPILISGNTLYTTNTIWLKQRKNFHCPGQVRYHYIKCLQEVMMLTDAEFLIYCNRLNFNETTRALVQQIRTSPPTRVVGGGKSNMPTRFTSRKMGRIIQAESHTVEFAAALEYENASDVLEMWDQPSPQIKLNYLDRNERRQAVLHTPDYFVIRTDDAGWEEWKTEEKLRELAEKQPNRYVFDEEQNRWRCPPGETHAVKEGLYYRVRSDAEINWIYQRNCIFLDDYRHPTCPPVPQDICTRVQEALGREPGTTLNELCWDVEEYATRDQLYKLIADELIYTDLKVETLVDLTNVHVFCDIESAKAHSTAVQSSSPFVRPSVVRTEAGSAVLWDGKIHTVLNAGRSEITLQNEEGKPISLPFAAFETLIRKGKITGLGDVDASGIHPEVEQRFRQANTDDLAMANNRFATIRPALDGMKQSQIPNWNRSARRYLARFKHAQKIWGCGYAGLLSRVGNRGNRVERCSEESLGLAQQFIETKYETAEQKNAYHVWGEYVAACDDSTPPIPPVSYKKFRKLIHLRDKKTQTEKRAGSRAAYEHEPFYWVLTAKTPKHGDRPFEICHIDHTELDIEVVDSETGKNLGRPWLTVLLDARTRRVLVVYLTFDPPSYRTCMMVMRLCVMRWGRFPQMLVVDGGKEFQSVYFESLLARYGCTKKTRPPAKPRFGSLVERFFGTTNTQFVNNLRGNTQIMKRVRQVTKMFDPRRRAVWTLPALWIALQSWVDEIYDLSEHSALGQSPRDAFEQGRFLYGAREHMLIPYTQEFYRSTLPSTDKGEAKVQPQKGIQIQYKTYWNSIMSRPDVEGTMVSIRYDPDNGSIAYAYIKGQWLECSASNRGEFEGRSEREIQLATTELRKRDKLSNKGRSITAVRLARFLVSKEAEEPLFLQRRQDAEARIALAIITGDLASVSGHSPAEQPDSSASVSSRTDEQDVLAGTEYPFDDDDLCEDL